MEEVQGAQSAASLLPWVTALHTACLSTVLTCSFGVSLHQVERTPGKSTLQAVMTHIVEAESQNFGRPSWVSRLQPWLDTTITEEP